MVANCTHNLVRSSFNFTGSSLDVGRLAQCALLGWHFQHHVRTKFGAFAKLVFVERIDLGPAVAIAESLLGNFEELLALADLVRFDVACGIAGRCCSWGISVRRGHKATLLIETRRRQSTDQVRVALIEYFAIGLGHEFVRLGLIHLHEAFFLVVRSQGDGIVGVAIQSLTERREGLTSQGPFGGDVDIAHYPTLASS